MMEEMLVKIVRVILGIVVVLILTYIVGISL